MELCQSKIEVYAALAKLFRCLLVFPQPWFVPGVKRDKKDSYAPFFHWENSEQKSAGVKRFLVLPGLNLFLSLSQHCTLDRVYFCDQLS